MSLAIAVVGHTQRTQQAARLAQQLAPAALFLDDGTLGEWANHERALLWGTTAPASHLLVIQDDAVPVDGFLTLANLAAAERPDDLIGLYVGKQRPRAAAVTQAVAQANRDGASWLTSSSLWWGVATIFPVELLAELLWYCQTSDKPYDRRIGTWAKQTGRPVLYTWPSLVDHADQPTVIEGRPERTPGRTAHRVGAPSFNDIAVRFA